MDNKPIISISDFENKKIVSFRYLDCKDIDKLSLIVERDSNDVIKIYVDSQHSYCVYELDDSGHPLFQFNNKGE